MAAAQSAVESESSNAKSANSIDSIVGHDVSGPVDAGTDVLEDLRKRQEVTSTLAPFLIRLHLIRHGETEANVKNLVLGQGDSPLTERGLSAARLAAASDIINGKKLHYWKTFCSDLERAHRSARIVLGLEGENCNENKLSPINLIVDSRLRELAKGAREGFDKSLSYEEAISVRISGSDADQKNDDDIPLLESIEDAWNRVHGWIKSLIEDATHDYYSLKNEDRVECNSEAGESDTNSKKPKIYDVFALSHSALIRTMIHQMVNSQLPLNHARTNEGSLRIPNLSRTIIDVRPHLDQDENDNNSLGVGKKIWCAKNKWTATLVQLTDVSHLSESSANGPPYL